MIRSDIHSDHPIDGWFRTHHVGYPEAVILEIGVVLLTLVCFVVLDFYVIGCDKV